MGAGPEEEFGAESSLGDRDTVGMHSQGELAD
jgi:hypothetical protein